MSGVVESKGAGPRQRRSIGILFVSGKARQLTIFQPHASINTPLLGNQQTLFRFIEILRAEW
jgi:hypothetical protein